MKFLNKRIMKYTPALLVLMISGLIGCSGDDTESKSMEQLYADEGVPVRVQNITPQRFISETDFTATLTGIEESSAHSLIADRVDKIQARVGDYVAKDSVIVTFPTDNPAAGYYQAKVQFENATATYKRMQDYYQAGGLSKQNFDNAEAAYRVAEANWDAASQSVLVRAPISGVLSRLNIRQSDNVEKEDELFTISRTDHLKATVWVPEANINAFKVDLPARVVWNGTELNGHVSQVDRSVNNQHQAFGVVAIFDNPESAIPSGVTATVSITTYQNDSTITTARKNIMSDHEGNYVFIAEGTKAVKRYVNVGRRNQLDIEVANGLSSGDMLITEGQVHLQEGSLIKILNGTVTPSDTVTEQSQTATN